MATGNVSVLHQILDPLMDSLTLETAKKIAALRANAASQARIDDLARKANHGQLSDAERSEYAAIVEAVDIISILQVKARTILAEHGIPWTPPSDD